MPYAHVHDVDLYYEAGGQGAPVVFVHGGFPSLASTLDDFSRWRWTWEQDFAGSFHFIWYDRRGVLSFICACSLRRGHLPDAAAGEGYR